MQRPIALGILVGGLCFVAAQIQPNQGLLPPLLAGRVNRPKPATPPRFALPSMAEIAASRMARESALERVGQSVRAQPGAPARSMRPPAQLPRVQAVADLKILRMVAVAEPAPTVAEPAPTVAATETTTPASGNLPSLDPTNGGEISSPFGYRTFPFPEFHRGLDLAAPTGRPVLVTANGRVVYAGWQGGFGKKIEVDHGNGYVTWYGHLSKIEVAIGEQVARGAVIGEVGATGEATGPHLHYQIMRNGIAIDPLPYLRGRSRSTENPFAGRTPNNPQGIKER